MKGNTVNYKSLSIQNSSGAWPWLFWLYSLWLHPFLPEFWPHGASEQFSDGPCSLISACLCTQCPLYSLFAITSLIGSCPPLDYPSRICLNISLWEHPQWSKMLSMQHSLGTWGFHRRFTHCTFINFCRLLLSKKPYILLQGRDDLFVSLNSSCTAYSTGMLFNNIGSCSNSQTPIPNLI